MNAAIIADSGGTCVCPTADLCLSDPIYLACVGEVRRDLITATAAISALSTFLMGLLANLPVGLAPGLGLNAYVSVQLISFHIYGSDRNSFSLRTPSWDSMAVDKSPSDRLWLLSSWRGTHIFSLGCGPVLNNRADGFSSSSHFWASVNGSLASCPNLSFLPLGLASACSLREFHLSGCYPTKTDRLVQVLLV